MRRVPAVRNQPPRPKLAFEPLEPRELLAADFGVDWWSAADVTVDDWSWTFDDASNVDAGGGSSWDDAWWAGDVSWDQSAADGTDSGASDVGGGDGAVPGDAGFDWSAPGGGSDSGSTAGSGPEETSVVDVVTPPIVPDAGGTPDVPPTTGVDVVSPPTPQPPVAVVPPEVVPPVPPTDPIVVTPDSDPIDGVEGVVQSDPAVDGGVTTDDVTTDDVTTDDVTTDDVTTDPIDDATNGSSSFDTPLPDVLPSLPQPDTRAADDPVTDVKADDADVPPVVVVTPDRDRPSPLDGVPVAVEQAAAPAPATNRFAGWGAMFFQAFGRPAGDADGAVAGGTVTGQSGSGRTRVRLPFRPIA